MACKAVLVGINLYDGYIRHKGHVVPLQRHRLYGCVNDVHSISDLLIQHFGFVPADIQELTDGSAIQSAILAALKGMVNSAAPGDRLLFYFSGHGSLYRRTPPSNDPKREEPIFEILCPYDMDWDQEIFISESDLRNIVNLLPDGAAIEMVLDACGAGGMRRIVREYGSLMQMPLLSRAADASLPQSLRFLVPPPEVLARIMSAQGNMANPRIMSTLGSAGPKRCILWAASGADQISDEFIPSHGLEHGAFTFFLNEVLTATSALDRGIVLQEVSQRLKEERFRQVPGLFPDLPLITQNRFLNPGEFT
ncbi:MAG: caspase family protein [Steroidobacteraceae bacterium]|jgi:hypothetical protein